MQRHRKNIVYGAYIAVMILLVVIIILLFSPKANAPKLHSTKGMSTSESQSNSRNKTSVSTKAATTGSQTADSSAPNLADTGPGDVVALFVASSTMFGILHYALSRRKHVKIYVDI